MVSYLFFIGLNGGGGYVHKICMHVLSTLKVPVYLQPLIFFIGLDGMDGGGRYVHKICTYTVSTLKVPVYLQLLMFCPCSTPMVIHCFHFLIKAL